jgi:hypothetical protein
MLAMDRALTPGAPLATTCRFDYLEERNAMGIAEEMTP